MAFPIRWKELSVIIEAIVCNPSVLAFRQGSVLKIAAHGRMRFVVETVTKMAGALRKIHMPSRRADHERAQQMVLG